MNQVREKESISPLRRRLIFVGGSPRSGTTLVQRLLDAHPEIAGGPEFIYINEICSLYKKMVAHTEDKRIDFYFNKKELTEIFEKFIQSLFSKLYEKYNVRIVSEKTPSNVFSFDTLSKIFNDAYFIYVIRDPKDILASHIAVKKRAISKSRLVPYELRNLFLTVDHIYEHFKAGFDFYNDNKDKTLIIKYEDAITKQNETIERICNFIGVPLEYKMLNLNGHANEYLERRVKNVESIYYSADEVTMPMTSKRISNWKNKLPASYANLVDIVFNTFDSNNSRKAASGRILFAIYKIHRLLIKKNNFSGKLYRNIITRIDF